MYTFILMVVDFFRTGSLHWYMIFMILLLVRWAVVHLVALRYTPYSCENKAYFTSVIIPVVDESPALFDQVLQSIAGQKPGEIIVVINGPENPPLLKVCRDVRDSCRAGGVFEGVILKTIHVTHPGKRSAIRYGVRNLNVKSDITILVDSDTIWTDGTLDNLLMPFSSDEAIGGVTTRQKICQPERSLTTMVANLIEEIRAEGTMKAMSVNGKVGCLPGRTIAFRTKIVREAMDEFMTEVFMGIHKEVSDDRSLTNITLKKGYHTVLQDTAVVYTDAPVKWRKFLRQQLRWAEGSQYNNLRMAGWMLHHARLMLFIFATDMLLPILLISTYTNTFFSLALKLKGYALRTVTCPQPAWMIPILVLAGAALGMALRNIRAMKKLPFYYILMMPLFIAILSFVMAPLRLVGLMRCADDTQWGTRELEEIK